MRTVWKWIWTDGNSHKRSIQMERARRQWGSKSIPLSYFCAHPSQHLGLLCVPCRCRDASGTYWVVTIFVQASGDYSSQFSMFLNWSLCINQSLTLLMNSLSPSFLLSLLSQTESCKFNYKCLLLLWRLGMSKTSLSPCLSLLKS